MDQVIIIDTREQLPFEFEMSETKTLNIGDYSIAGFEDNIAIERKSITDAVGSVLGGMKRFLREIKSAKENLENTGLGYWTLPKS